MFNGLKELPHPIVFVFGGGGSRGAAHAGQMKALAEFGVVPDATIGTSVGSISAAVVAEDPQGSAATLETVWGEIKKSNAFPGSVLSQLAKLTMTGNHLYSQDALRETLRTHVKTVRIEDLAIPYAAVATDYEAAQPCVLTSGSLETAMAASAAIPGVFPMVEVDGRKLCDGGVVANVPVIEAQLLSAKSIVILDCIGPVNTAHEDIVDIIAGSAGIMMHKQRVADIASVAADLPVVYMPPPRTAGSPLNFSHTHDLIEDTYASGMAFLESVKVRENPPPALYGEIPTALPPDESDDPGGSSLPKVAIKVIAEVVAPS